MARTIWLGNGNTLSPARNIWVNQNGTWIKVKGVWVKQNGIWMQTFPPSGTLTITASTNIQFPAGASTCDICLVGGGSAGLPAYFQSFTSYSAPSAGGGGGGGGVVYQTGISIDSTLTYAINIGSGGIASLSSNTPAGNTTFNGFTAYGGGSSSGGSVTSVAYGSGDSKIIVGSNTSGPYSPTQGNYGGSSSFTLVNGYTAYAAGGGGGGGASAGGYAATNGTSSTGGNGGAGFFDPISQHYYSGGGGGGGITAGNGGVGGGGAGGSSATYYGGGGGGGRFSNSAGGNGYQGIAIIRYY